MLLGMRSPKVGPTPVGAWRASTSTLAQLAALATHSSTSLATMFDSTGMLTYGPNNLLLNNTSASGWTGGTVTGGIADPIGGTNALTFTATAPNQQIYKNIGTQNAANTIVFAMVKRRTGSGAVSMANAQGAIFTPIAVTGTWQLFAVTQTAPTTTWYFNLLFATSGDAVDVYLPGISVVTYETTPRTADQVITTSSTYYGPRIDYDPNTLAVKGLLIEEARTNLFVNSGSLSSTSTISAVKSTDGTLAPDGVTSMTKLTASADTASHELYNTAAMSVTSGGTYTASIFVKKGNYRYVFVTGGIASNGGFCAVFDLDNPSASTQSWPSGGSASIIGSKIENMGGGIYRIQASGAIGTGTTGYLVAGFAGAATGNSTATVEPSWTAAGTEYGYFFGGQLELGSFATSYIPTAAASITRAADVVQFTGAALTALQGSAGSAVVEHTSELTTQPGTLRLIGTTSSRALIYGLSDTSAASWNGSVSLNATIGSSGKFSTTARTAAAWSASGRSIVANGGTVATDANAAFGGVSPAGAWLGSDGGTANWGSGWYKSFALYNQRLPDATLQTKSVVGASY